MHRHHDSARVFGRGVCTDSFTSEDGPSAHIDMYNQTSNSWTRNPLGLGQARDNMAAASLPFGLVFFAGGFTGATVLVFG
jgi:hypothetical protein